MQAYQIFAGQYVVTSDGLRALVIEPLTRSDSLRVRWVFTTIEETVPASRFVRSEKRVSHDSDGLQI